MNYLLSKHKGNFTQTTAGEDAAIKDVMHSNLSLLFQLSGFLPIWLHASLSEASKQQLTGAFIG